VIANFFSLVGEVIRVDADATWFDLKTFAGKSMHAASLTRFVQASQLIAKRWLARHALELKGFSAQNLWRMKQFYEIYHQNEKLSPAVRVLSPEAKGVFKDTYLLDFLDLPEVYSEHDLQAGLIKNLCKFLLEL